MKTISAAPVTPKKRSAVKVASAALQKSYERVSSLAFPVQANETILSFFLPLSPVSLNSRLHWRSKNALRLQYEAHFDVLLAAGLIPPPPQIAWERARISATFHTKRLTDFDNLLGKAKWSLDLLTRKGYILDDNPNCLEWEGMPRQELDTRHAGYLVIMLQRLEVKK